MGRWKWIQRLRGIRGQRQNQVNTVATPIPPANSANVPLEETNAPHVLDPAPERTGIGPVSLSKARPTQSPTILDRPSASTDITKRSAAGNGDDKPQGAKESTEVVSTEVVSAAVSIEPVARLRIERGGGTDSSRAVEVRPPRPYPRLGALHRAMLRTGLNRVIFTGTNNGSKVETLFCADDDPMALCVAVTHPSGAPTCAFEWEVEMPDYRVNTHLGDKYGDLLDALGLIKGQRGIGPFKPSDFLFNVLTQAPKVLSTAHEPRPSQVHRLRVGSTVEEADKTFFIGWRNNQRWGQHVTAANLRKTAKLIGADCANMCELRNISTCWSDKPGRREPTPSEITRDARQRFAGDWG